MVRFGSYSGYILTTWREICVRKMDQVGGAEAIVTNVIAPYAIHETKREMETVNFITVLTDSSNHGDLKMQPVLARYFHPDIGVRIKVLSFSTVPGKTSDIITGEVKNTVESNQLASKVVGFCGDNMNTNFGGRLRRGQNNVYAKLKQLY